MVQNAVSTRRRGMVLMIVLALLAMVSLTAVTFLLTTEQLRDAAEQNRQLGESTVDPDAMLHDTVMQIIRGTGETGSPIYGNSLLEDMYGVQTPRFIDTAAVSNEEAVNGMVEVNLGTDASRYVGRVLTCVDTDSKTYGKSTVILKNEGNVCYCLPFPDGTGFDTNSKKFMINEMPFQDIRDYDAVDEHNYFLTRRNAETGRIDTANTSFRNGSKNYGMADADNDGYHDSYWLDLGTPAMASKNGTLFKPLFGIIVEDMDGRLNVNAHGDVVDRLGKSLGMGRGPGEVGLNVLDSLFGGGNISDRLVKGRFSAERNPASPTPDRTATSEHKGGWYANFDEGALTGDKVQRMPYDIRGILKLSVGTGAEPVWTSSTGNFQQISNGAIAPNPYDLDLGMGHVSGIRASGSGSPSAATDMPYSPSELEALLRPFDFDSPFLPNRLRKYLGLSQNSGNANQKAYARTLVTTESWDIPVIPNELVNDLRNHAGELSSVREVLAGWPLDLLRAATFNDVNDPIQGDGRFRKREAFAKCLYLMLQNGSINANMGDGDENRARNNAQWAVNVVDFLDADSIMTPFNYDGNNWVYGCERPELLLVESMAIHSINSEFDVRHEDSNGFIGGKNGTRKNAKDTVIYETDESEASLENELEETHVERGKDNFRDLKGFHPDGNRDFDQLIRPQGALFVEIFNPWKDSERFPTISNDLYTNGTRNVDLTKLGGNSSVWRLVVMDASVGEDSDSRDETDPNWDSTKVERVINFAPGTSSTDGSAANHAAKGGTSVSLAGGEYVLVGPEGTTVLSFADPGETAVSEISTADHERTIDMTSKKVDGAAYVGQHMLEISDDGDVRMSLTEDRNTNYPAFNRTTLQLNAPLDKPLDNDRGLRPQEGRVIHLQRLANPNRGHDASTNPYVTIDSISVDLEIINARTSKKDSEFQGSLTSGEIVTHKRGKTVSDSGAHNIWKQSHNKTSSGNGNSGTGGYAKRIDQNFGTGVTMSESVPWLGWVNRPPVSPLELMNVTFCRSSELLRKVEFGETGGEAGLERYGYLPDFDGNNRKILGCVRVPSPQTVTPMVLNRANLQNAGGVGTTDSLPFAYYSMYREPGRINVNTIYDQNVLAALLNLNATEISSVWTNFQNARNNTPFRSIAQAPESSVLRDFSLFQGTAVSADAGTSEANHPFFRLKDAYRLGNLTTTRSNVFAVWVTMGFFEVDGNENIVTDGNGPVELGEQTGEVRRYRAFYLIDRSIPVGFERGKNHNAENVILLKRMLQ